MGWNTGAGQRERSWSWNIKRACKVGEEKNASVLTEILPGFNIIITS